MTTQPDNSTSAWIAFITLNGNECVPDEYLNEPQLHEDSEHNSQNDDYSTDGV